MIDDKSWVIPTVLTFFVIFSIFGIAKSCYDTGYKASQKEYISELQKCSQLEIKEGYQFATYSKNFGLTIFYDGKIKFGKYDEDHNWLSYEIEDKELPGKLKIVLNDMIENNMIEGE